MFEKSGKFYADWRDADGIRKRKSFRSKKAALQFEAEQKELANPKPQARRKTSPHCFSPRSKPSTAETTSTKREKSSSALQVVSRRKN